MAAIDRDFIRNCYQGRFANKTQGLPDCDVQKQYLGGLLKQYYKKNDRILDAGCGNGEYSQYLVNSGYRDLFAVDLFDHLDLADPIDYRKASIDDLPYDNSTFDIIFCYSVIFYLDSVEKGINELNRVLKRNGFVLITAHTKYSLYTLWRILKRRFQPESVKHLQGVKFHSAAFYKKILNDSGFEVKYVDGYFSKSIIKRVYYMIRRSIQKRYGYELPCFTLVYTKNKLIRCIRSVIGYHSVILARKL
jgi:SAM-dependent methyltransferase